MKATHTQQTPSGGSDDRLIRLSDSVRALDGDLGKRVRALEIQLEAAKSSGVLFSRFMCIFC